MTATERERQQGDVLSWVVAASERACLQGIPTTVEQSRGTSIEVKESAGEISG